MATGSLAASPAASEKSSTPEFHAQPLPVLVAAAARLTAGMLILQHKVGLVDAASQCVDNAQPQIRHSI
jgi:hypothetical protein